MTTSAPPKAVTFASRGPNQTITVEGPRKPQYDTLGRVIVTASRGKIVEFQNNLFVANEESAAKLDVPLDELLVFLRGHENFNQNRPGGFWEEGAAPDEPRPTLSEQMQAVAVASAAGDRDVLAAIRELETDTHQRVAVLQAIDAAESALAARDTASPSEDEGAGEPSADGSEGED